MSLQTVPLETPILSAASSCESPSRSTSLWASISAGSMYMVRALSVYSARALLDSGANPSVSGCLAMLTGFGILPLLPCFRLNLNPIGIGTIT